MTLAAALLLVEATGLNIYDVMKVPALMSSYIVSRGGVQEGRHRELRFLGALASQVHCTKDHMAQIGKQSEGRRYPMREFRSAKQREKMQAEAKKELARIREAYDGH